MKKVKYALLAIAGIVLLVLIAVGFMTIKNMVSNKPYTFNMSSTTVVKEIRSLSRLETSSFTIEKVIDAGTNGNTFQEFLYGDRILLIAHGQVVAGIDFSALSEDDVHVSGQTVTIKLPPAQILTTTLDNGQTRVFDRKLGLLSKGDKDLESQARLAATEAIQQAACKGNILTDASTNARKQLTALLRALGFVTITIEIPESSC